MSKEHSLQMAVRDYECDMQGVVNNAVYQNYLEHARHACLKSFNIDFAALTQAGVHLVVVRAELDYKGSLTSGDSFTVFTRMEQVSRLRFAFHQQIIRDHDQKQMIAAVITGAGLNQRGRPFLPPELISILEDTSEQH